MKQHADERVANALETIVEIGTVLVAAFMITFYTTGGLAKYEGDLNTVGVLLSLDLRLGEGTGALLALPLLASAAATLAQMATFTSAGVSDRDA